MPYHSNRRKPPSRFRCLKHLFWPAAAVTVALDYPSLMDATCDLFKSLTHQATCPGAEMPATLVWALAAISIYGLVAFAHRAYRDFYKNDLLWEFPTET